MHAFSNLNRNIPNQNSIHSFALLPWNGLDWWNIGIYGPQNACVFCICKWATRLNAHLHTSFQLFEACVFNFWRGIFLFKAQCIVFLSWLLTLVWQSWLWQHICFPHALTVCCNSTQLLNTGNQKCQGLGGRLPTVTTIGKANFLQTTFTTDIWIGLRTDSIL